MTGLHQAHGDTPMIPDVIHRQEMEPYLEDLVTEISFIILDWKDSEHIFKINNYETLTNKGFKNPEFKGLVQLAVDYCDYLIFNMRIQAETAIRDTALKVIDTHLGRSLHKTGQLRNLLPGAQNHYQRLINEYPTLERQVSEHLSKFNQGKLGAREMKGPYIDQQTGQLYIVDEYNRRTIITQEQANYYQQQQQFRPQVDPHTASMMRRNSSYHGYGQQQPPMQMPHPGYQQQQPYMPPVAPHNLSQSLGPAAGVSWGANPTTNNVTPTSPPLHRGRPMPVPGQSQNQNYANYSNQQQGYQGQVDVNGVPLSPQAGYTAPRPPQHSGYKDSVYMAPPPQAENANPAPINNTINDWQKTGVTTTTVPVSNNPDGIHPKLIKVTGGYELDYYEAMDTGLDGTRLPVIFDAKSRKGIYQFDTRGKCTGLRIINIEESEMDYNKHENTQYFAKERLDAIAPSKAKTSKMLADIQRQLFVDQTILEVMSEGEEGNVTGSTEGRDLTTPIFISKPLYADGGELGYLQTLTNYLDGDNYYLDRVVNFDQIKHAGIVLTGDCVEVGLRLRECTNYRILDDILNELLELGLPLVDWTYLNQVATKFINSVLKYRLGLTIYIQSFNTDIEDLISLLKSEYSISTEFTSTAKELVRRWFTPVPHTDPSFMYFHSHLLNESDDDAEVPVVQEPMLGFFTVSDVTSLPIESSSIFIPVPDGETDEDGVVKAAIVTEDSFPELYQAIADRMNTSGVGATHVVFITKDGKSMYIEKTGNNSSYVITPYA